MLVCRLCPYQYFIYPATNRGIVEGLFRRIEALYSITKSVLQGISGTSLPESLMILLTLSGSQSLCNLNFRQMLRSLQTHI